MLRFSPNPNRADSIPWYEWGEEALCAARAQNKPIMLFLCAFWCRYCQRMDEEAFSETENIALLRAYFISMRAENGQRPDLDVRYNQNGWPTIVFMTPLGAPIVAANYLTAEQFEDLLLRVYMEWQRQPKEAAPANAVRNEQRVARSPAKPRLEPSEAVLAGVSKTIMTLADREHGGYGSGQKFIHPEVNDFLLSRYETTRDEEYLAHVRLTLDRMRWNGIYDARAGGYFRTSTGPAWDRPHREKLLAEQAGLLGNCLELYRLTSRPEYARMAEEIVHYLEAKLFVQETGAFHGCEDFLRIEAPREGSNGEYFTILDKCFYTDANALAANAYLKAGSILGNGDYRGRALQILEFLRLHCRNPAGGMFHCFDGNVQLAGWLPDQVLTGSALLHAYAATRNEAFLEQARELAEYVVAGFKNQGGGYYDLEAIGAGYLSVRLTLIEFNGAAALFFIAAAKTTGESRWHEAARWALSAFTEDFASYGVHAAAYGRALNQYLTFVAALGRETKRGSNG
jgi:uncharacterized protein YyaL (SSP411 family)